MVTLIIDKYKLEFFTFEKMGSRSIESAVLGKVGLGGPEGIIDPHCVDYDPKIKIRNINGGFEITGGIFDYRKYEDRLSESYYDNELERVIDELWPSDYTRILVYRDSYKRLVSAFYWLNNIYYNDNYYNSNIKKYKDLVFPKKETITEHRRCFKNFCRLCFVDGKISDGHLSAIWEQIPENYLNRVDYKINLENFNADVVKILKKLKVDRDKRDKFSKVLVENKIYFKNKKSRIETDDGIYEASLSGPQVQRVSDDYYSYYEDMPREILDAINTFYEIDLDYTGTEKL